jgi:hypothetical protein
VNWAKRLEIPSGGVIQWLRGVGNRFSRGLGFTTDDKMYFIRNTSDDASGTVTYDMVIDGNGNVGIGTSNPGHSLDVAGGVALEDYIQAKTTAGLALRTYNNTTARVLVANNGNVGIGVASPAEKLDVDGTVRLRGLPTGSGTTVVADGNGRLLKQSSSRRYKTNIRSLEDNPEAVLSLRPVTFEWKQGGQEEVGLIAEEVDEVLGDLVLHDAEGRPDAVKYDKISLYLLAVVKELKSENEALRRRVDALERKMERD